MAPVITVTTQPVADPEVPTLTHYQQVAADLMTALEAFADIIPKVEEAEATAEPQHARRNLNVPDAFCYTAVTAAEQAPELESMKKLYAEKSRNRLQYIEAIRPVYDKITVVQQRLGHGLYANKSIVATDALEIYRVARAQVKRNPGLGAHVAAMKRDLAKKVKTKAEREERKAAKLRKEVEKFLAEQRAAEMPPANYRKEATEA